LLLSLLLGALSFRRLQQPMRLVLLFLLATLLVEIAIIYHSLRGLNNHYLYNYASLANVGFFLVLYYAEITGLVWRRVLVALGLCYAAVFALTPSQEGITAALTAEKIILFLVALMHFHFLLTEANVYNLLRYPAFVLSSGLAVCSAGSLLIFLFREVTLNSPHQRDVFLFYWYIGVAFNSLFYVAVLVALWLARTHPKPAPPDPFDLPVFEPPRSALRD